MFFWTENSKQKGHRQALSPAEDDFAVYFVFLFFPIIAVIASSCDS